MAQRWCRREEGLRPRSRCASGGKPWFVRWRLENLVGVTGRTTQVGAVCARPDVAKCRSAGRPIRANLLMQMGLDDVAIARQ